MDYYTVTRFISSLHVSAECVNIYVRGERSRSVMSHLIISWFITLNLSLNTPMHFCVHMIRVCINLHPFVCNDICMHDYNSLISSSPSATASSSAISGLFTQMCLWHSGWRHSLLSLSLFLSLCLCMCRCRLHTCFHWCSHKTWNLLSSPVHICSVLGSIGEGKCP